MSKAQEKRWADGEKLYDDFVERLHEAYGLTNRVSNPTTFTTEKFALLAKRENLKDLLLTEMMREYLTNFSDFRIVVQKGALYYTNEVLLRL